MPEILLTVRELARFCHRSGDIDHRFTPAPTGLQGIAGHQRIYRARPASYQREFAVEFSRAGAPAAGAPAAGTPALRLRGRADGYDREQQLVEEIKTCRIDPARIPEAVSRLGLAQGRLYAAMIAAQEDLPGLTVQLTWLQIDSGEEQVLQQAYTRAELDAFLEDSLERYGAWLTLVAQRRAARDASLQDLPFPHPQFRPGQRALSERVYKCIHQAGRLLLEAPTGIGKTAAVLYPALKALATGRHDSIVFATTRISGRRAAQQAMARFADAGYAGNALSLMAKDQVCLSPGRACHGEDCPYARGYYDRLPVALEDALAEPLLDPETLAGIARGHEVCPYQLSLDLAPWADVIVADVHHVFSPTANLADRLSEDGRRWTVLLDEAHGLPDRARQMYGAELPKATIMAARREAPAVLKPALDRLNRRLLELQKLDWQQPQSHWLDKVPPSLGQSLEQCAEAVAAALAQDPFLLQSRPALRDSYFVALQCLRVLDLWGEEFSLELVRSREPQSLRLLLHCLDPARLLALRQQALHALVVFSATLSPQQWALDSLGLDASAVAWRAPSPFAREQLQVLLATHVDTRYQQRNASLGQLALLLREWLAAEPGNCLLYFSSYQYLQSCLQAMDADGWPGERRLWIQGRAPQGRDELLQLLQEERNVAAFCVLGGAFGEGIDLPGDQLSSVVVVGVGLPQVNSANERLRELYQRRYGAGFAHAYQYPGLQKVSQAIGRVVRTETDRGKALLIDSRYADPACRALLPPWWSYRDYAAPGSR
ncbi:ATP-dependent DNA helicase [Haliea sp. E1-2-M8]|uniref:ATP-dependent DNA helicase n=1 Tax=Haliea sp. E1-2-M8 TaxID=3064706 RepID=UPI002723D9B4|nr:ATP-dependent DNA helicase [Haliea sp. E1-2-M8]MDO8860949.1 ATP-dependent DNA helicase [Haliea sp. E1-2-M8]